jgi:hypothetical protein
MTKTINLNEHPEFFALLAQDRVIGQTEFGCDITATPLTDEQQKMIQTLKQGLAAGNLQEVRPGVFKYTAKGICELQGKRERGKEGLANKFGLRKRRETRLPSSWQW